MAEMILVSKVDHSRPTLKIKALEEKLSAAGMATFFATHATPMFQKRARDRFANEGDEAVGRWAPLAQSTIRRREAKGQVPIRINDRTGVMKEWVTNSPGRVISTKAGSTLEWPSTAKNKTVSKKMKVAQQGLTSPYTPARPVVGVDQEDLFTLMALLESWIE